jgi:hypothetical protein
MALWNATGFAKKKKILVPVTKYIKKNNDLCNIPMYPFGERLLQIGIGVHLCVHVLYLSHQKPSRSCIFSMFFNDKGIEYK